MFSCKKSVEFSTIFIFHVCMILARVFLHFEQNFFLLFSVSYSSDNYNRLTHTKCILFTKYDKFSAGRAEWTCKMRVKQHIFFLSQLHLEWTGKWSKSRVCLSKWKYTDGIRKCHQNCKLITLSHLGQIYLLLRFFVCLFERALFYSNDEHWSRNEILVIVYCILIVKQFFLIFSHFLIRLSC